MRFICKFFSLMSFLGSVMFLTFAMWAPPVGVFKALFMAGVLALLSIASAVAANWKD